MCTRSTPLDSRDSESSDHRSHDAREVNGTRTTLVYRRPAPCRRCRTGLHRIPPKPNISLPKSHAGSRITMWRHGGKAASPRSCLQRLGGDGLSSVLYANMLRAPITYRNAGGHHHRAQTRRHHARSPTASQLGAAPDLADGSLHSMSESTATPADTPEMRGPTGSATTMRGNNDSLQPPPGNHTGPLAPPTPPTVPTMPSSNESGQQTFALSFTAPEPRLRTAVCPPDIGIPSRTDGAAQRSGRVRDHAIPSRHHDEERDIIKAYPRLDARSWCLRDPFWDLPRAESGRNTCAGRRTRS